MSAALYWLDMIENQRKTDGDGGGFARTLQDALSRYAVHLKPPLSARFCGICADVWQFFPLRALAFAYGISDCCESWSGL